MKRLTLATAVAAAGLCALPAQAEDDTLTIWGARDTDQLQAVADRFTEDFGIEVVIETPSEPEKQFTVVAGSGEGPDIFFFAHDRIGEYVSGGLLSEVQPGRAIREANSDIGWQAVTYDGRYWGYPISTEAIGLVYNKELIDTPPQSFEQMFELQAELADQDVETIAWAYEDPYFSYPVLAAGGGYAFASSANGYDTSDVGVDGASFQDGAAFINRALETGLLARDTDYSIMDSKFSEGEVAMMINGPWSWPNAAENGIDYAVAPLPTLNGEPARPFVGVYSAMINANSANQAAAVEFLENYLLSHEGLKTWNANGEVGAVTHQAYLAELSENPDIQALAESTANGTPMPNVPEMGAFWGAMETALANFTSGRQDIDDALSVAADKMR